MRSVASAREMLILAYRETRKYGGTGLDEWLPKLVEACAEVADECLGAHQPCAGPGHAIRSVLADVEKEADRG